MDAIILAGGLGTRLAPVVPHLPKTLAPIRGVPFLQVLLKQLEASRCISRVILALGYRAAEVERSLTETPPSLPVVLSVESTPLGTGGALLQALTLVHSPSVLVMNGDSYCDVSIPALSAFHKKRSADITIVSCAAGALSADSSGRVLSFHEKGSATLVNAGIYLMNGGVFSHLSVHPCSLERDLFPSLLHRPVFTFQHAGGFIDIGTPSSYHLAQRL